MVSVLHMNLEGASVLLLLSVFGCTESNPQTGITGFPQRLFVLPVSSFELVAVPTALAIFGIGAFLLVSGVLSQDEQRSALLVLMLIYMVVYQAVLWTMPSLRSLRLLVLGITAVLFIMVPGLAFLRGTSEVRILTPFGIFGFAAFLISWLYVSHQRSGGGSNLAWMTSLVLRLLDRFPHREKTFPSPLDVQVWFEWRRSGHVLPGLVASLLIGLIGPLSWWMRKDSGISLLILATTFIMPILLALPVGKAFSKPDFWSGDFGIPPILAVRPLDGADMVAVKLKVAAKSALMSWVFVVAFLSVWLLLWANLDGINWRRGLLWQISGHSSGPQYAIFALAIVAGVLLTWRFLVGSLWLGLSGSKRLFTLSALPYAIVPFAGLIGIIAVARNEQSVLLWIIHNLGSMLPKLVALAAVAVVLKASAAVFSWRNIRNEYVHRYFLVWCASAVSLVTLAVLLRRGLSALLPSDIYRLRALLILIALLLMPLARIGFAPSSFERNRHRH